MSINFDLLKPSASMEITRLAGQLKLLGRKVYPLSIGDTHFQPPKIIRDRINQLPSSYSHYTKAEGIDELRNQIANSYYGYDTSDIVLVPGLKQGFFYALASLQKKKLCVLEPTWLGYEAAALISDYELVRINTYEQEWLEKLNSTVFDVIILCSPNNPDGKILSQGIIEEIIEVSNKNQAWIITDFIYDKYCYNGNTLFQKNLFNYPRLIVGNGFSKSHAITGLRIGYLACNDARVIQRIITLQQNLATCVSALSQYALITSEDICLEISENADYYKGNKEMILDIFPEWKQFEPDGGFYFFIDLSIYSIQDGKSFCKHLLDETGVAIVPGAAYGNGFESFVRLSFSIEREILREALMLLKNFLNENY